MSTRVRGSMRAPVAPWGALSIALVSLLGTGIAAQDPVIVDIGLSADTVALGDRFDLTFTLVVPPGEIAYLPDSLTSAGVESFRPVQWAREPAADGGTRLAVTYELIAFQVGTVEVPDFALFTSRADEGIRAGLVDADAIVGHWSTFREDPAALPSARAALVPPQQLWVASVLLVDEGTGTITPRPAADVVGRSRHWLATIAAGAFAVLFIGAIALLLRDLATARRAGVPVDPRAAALQALDALLAEGAHRGGQVRAFYARSSEIVRRYVEGFDARWSPAWTSTELMRDLDARRRDEAVRALSSEMTTAESVKFGGARPDADAAERHLATVRDWVVRTPSADDDRPTPSASSGEARPHEAKP